MARATKQLRALNTSPDMLRELMRKIIHCDCDSFYASVEMRDDPALADQAVAIGGQRTGGHLVGLDHKNIGAVIVRHRHLSRVMMRFI